MPSPATRLQQYFMKKHDATRLHYDLRLGWNGVLKSFVVEDGPTDVAGNPRKAIEVEDHKREYGSFEGVIAEGKYGAGTVMLWDRGMWEPLTECADVELDLRNGYLRFTLHGEKLKGIWELIRRDKSVQNEKNFIWDLVKQLDSFARDGRSGDILKEAPNSVKSRKTLEEIKHEWNNPKRKKKSDGPLFDM